MNSGNKKPKRITHMIAIDGQVYETGSNVLVPCGKWLETDYAYTWECSECGSHHFGAKTKFCSNCGAKMTDGDTQ